MSRNLRYLVKGIAGMLVALALTFVYSTVKEGMSGTFGSPVKIIMFSIILLSVIYAITSLVRIVTYTAEEIEEIESKNTGVITFTVNYSTEYDLFMVDKAKVIAKEIEKFCPPDSTITIE